MKIFLDFDDTIFNSAKFKENFYAIFSKHGVTEEEFRETYYLDFFCHIDRKNKKRYDLSEQIRKLEESKGNLTQLKKELYVFLQDTRKYVFSDFYKFISHYNKEDLFLMSYGESDFHENKVERSRVLKYFLDYFITNESKGSLMARIIKERSFNKENIYFVDDRPDQLEDVAEKNPNIIAIRLKRPAGRYKELTSRINFQEVSNFKQLQKVIRDIEKGE